LLGWLSEPRVKKWWNKGEANLEKVKANFGPEEGLGRFILFFSERREAARPIAFIQRYRLPDGSIGSDQFIGDPLSIDQGVGTASVIEFTDKIFRELAPPFTHRHRALFENLFDLARTGGPLGVFGITNLGYDGAVDFYVASGATIDPGSELLFTDILLDLLMSRIGHCVPNPLI
jgi:hypothetical protein